MLIMIIMIIITVIIVTVFVAGLGPSCAKVDRGGGASRLRTRTRQPSSPAPEIAK